MSASGDISGTIGPTDRSYFVLGPGKAEILALWGTIRLCYSYTYIAGRTVPHNNGRIVFRANSHEIMIAIWHTKQEYYLEMHNDNDTKNFTFI